MTSRHLIYTATGAVAGLILPSVVVVVFFRMWGVELDREVAATTSFAAGIITATLGAFLGWVYANETENHK